MDFGIKGMDPEPRRGYRTRAARDRHLQEFSDAVWQRHEATHARGGPISEWPNRQTFKSNWPLLAEDLIVGDWKHSGAVALTEESMIEIDLLDPKPPVAVDWRTQFALELASQPELVFELSAKDKTEGIELVLERAELSPGERMAVRGWLQHRGALEPPYGGVVELIAEDLRERPQTVMTLLRNGLERLRWLGQSDAQGRAKSRFRERGLVSDRSTNGHARGTSAADVSPTAGPSNGARWQQGGGRGPASGRVRDLPAQAAGVR